MAKHDDKRQEESERIIDRIQVESDSGFVNMTTRRLEGHLGAKDADQNDWAEVWGTRIGRTIGAVVTVAAIIYLFQYLVSPT